MTSRVHATVTGWQSSRSVTLPLHENMRIMKKNITISLALIAIVCLAAVQTGPQTTPTVEIIRADYIQKLNKLERAMGTFAVALEDPEDEGDVLKYEFQNLRKAYKSVEYLLAYLSAETVKDFLNGPPLPGLFRSIPAIQVKEPGGLQTIEEKLYEEPIDKKEIGQLVQEMRNQYKSISNSQKSLPFTDRQVLEAMRAGIFRITSLGLSGFDTPASGNSIRESATSLKSIYKTARVYYPYIPKTRSGLADSLDARFVQAIRSLEENPDFDAFDRIHFIRESLEPLYGLTLELHKALGVEMVFHVHQFSQPTHYLSGSMFSEKTFNDHYYSGIGAKEESEAAISLGQTLFFDPILSSNNKRACASCHDPKKAFTDGVPKSLSMDFEGTVERNSPILINSVFADRYFLDLRSDRLENQAEHVIYNEHEFNTTVFKILDKLNQSEEYRAMFQDAFGKAPNPLDLSRALAAYVRSLKSFNSPVDKYLRGEDVTLSEDVQKGFNLFVGKAACGTCHFLPTFTGLVPPDFKENESEVLGVPADPYAEVMMLDPDEGRYNNQRAYERADHFRFSFKTTTVRNIALTAPYMHNGAYKTLEDVVGFYNNGGGAGIGFELENQTLPFDSLSLNEVEEMQLVRFMEALTDTTGLTTIPRRLPAFKDHPEWNDRRIGGEY